MYYKNRLKAIFCLILLATIIVACFGCNHKNNFTVQFVVDDQITSVAVKKGVVALPENPEKDGYDFVGWYIQQEDEDVAFDEAYPNGEGIDRNLVVVAKWQKQTLHHLTFIAEGTEVLTIFDVADGEVVQAYPIPIKEGYDFAGWSRTKEGTVLFDESTAIHLSLSLYAKWMPLLDFPTCTVKVYAEDAAPTEYTVKCGQTVSLEDPIRAGYRFDGWYVDEECQMEYDVSLAVTASFSLYAKWQQVSERLQVRFDTDGGSEESAITVKYDSLLMKPINPTKEGFDFVDWYDEDGFVFDFATRRIRKDTVIKAAWQEVQETIVYTVTFVKNNGEENETLSFVDSYPILIIPNKENSRFVGWYVDQELTKPYESLALIPYELTLYAMWNEELSDDEGMTFVEITGAGAYELAQYAGSLTEVSVPAEVNGLPVISIGDSAFAKTKVTSVSLPASIVTIGNDAFKQCSRLAKLTFEQNSQLQKVGKRAFMGTAIQQLRLGREVSLIDEFAFSEAALVNVLIEGPAVLSEGAMQGCTSLKYLSARNVIRLEINALEGCSALSELYLDSCVEISSWALANAFKLSTLSLPVCTTIQSSALENCVDLISITCPNLESIGVKAFYNCSKLREISIPLARSIGQEAFGYCISLSNVELGSGLASIGEQSFVECKNVSFSFLTDNANYKVVDGSLLRGDTLVVIGNIVNAQYTIPSVVKTVDMFAFANGGGIRQLTVGANVTDLGMSVGTFLTGIQQFVIDAGNTVYHTNDQGDLYKGNQLVRYVDSIERVEWVMPTGVSIAIGAFAKCSYLTDVTFADDYHEIEMGAFYQCTSLTTLHNTQVITRIEMAAFVECPNLGEVEWPADISIDEAAFEF